MPTGNTQPSENPMLHDSNQISVSEHLAKLPEIVRYYYARVPLEDLQKRPPEELLAAAMSHLNMAKVRPDGDCLVRVYNPTLAEHGWESQYTIVEITTCDKPFLVRSVSLTVASMGFTIQEFIHPIFPMARTADGKLEGMIAKEKPEAKRESFMQLHIDRHVDEGSFEQLEKAILETVENVNLVCHDWEPMKSACSDAAERLRSSAPDNFEIAESTDFIQWLQRYYFTFAGYCVIQKQGNTFTTSESLGIFNSDNALQSLSLYFPENELQSTFSDTLTITKSAIKAPLVRPVPMDIITFKHIDQEGKESGRVVVAGFFTARAAAADLESIPLIRHKTFNIFAKADINPGAYESKLLLATLESIPKDLLLQTDESTIYDICKGIMSLEHHPKVRVFTTQDRFKRFTTFFVYVPRDLYSRELRVRIQEILQHEISADSIEFDASFSSQFPMARMHFLVRTTDPQAPKDLESVQSLIIESAQSWDDNLREALFADLTEQHAGHISLQLSRGIPQNYKESHGPTSATRDLQLLNACGSEGIDVLLYKKRDQSEDEVSFNIYHGEVDVPLSKVVHILENMGLQVDSEDPFTIETEQAALNIREFDLRRTDGTATNIDAIADEFRKTFLTIWHGENENDRMNQLVVAAGLTARETSIARSYAKYLLQIKIPFSYDYMIDCLVKNQELTANLAEQFTTKFNPSLTSNNTDNLRQTYAELLDQVVSLDEDRILRTLQEAIDATIRTNYFITDENDQAKSYLSIKLLPAKIESMPLPHPAFEIFVSSPRFEATHLRGGKVARGGLRWSDRREDFRTEVLGLMKAQMVKNSVIVPVGSKGGFVVKQLPTGSRDEVLAEVISCYQNFLRGMLDITDNYIDGSIVQPANVVAHDETDPYLVVAADKGTATFSDIANGISEEYNFWLGDAFASGGSVGYDHKGMGITAKGAWESVKRHFRETDHNTQTTPFTVVGIGDMSGDVFGNGMLLSKEIKLLAAFNHLHIFIDPDPDTAKSYAERLRMFELPRSTWEDYDQSLISNGGGIYSRSAKSITLTPETQAIIDSTETQMTPNELIHALLKSSVDLIWNGGIGTYFKASSETHPDAQDKANDPVRVDANELRCSVVGEGGNLGCTQLARIEFASHGGRIYTDAIDNSAGVDCSDHEVNIKILVDSLVASNQLTAKKRPELLASMTDDVSDLVLRDNYLQTQCISLTSAEASKWLDEHGRFIQNLESQGKLNRKIEFLPDAEALNERATQGVGLTTPEIAVILAYSKMDIYEQLLEGSYADDPYFQQELLSYFPETLSGNYERNVLDHQLRKEIIATQITNSLVNRLGPTYMFRLRDELGAQTTEIATAYIAVRDMFKLRGLWHDIESLDNSVDNDTQTNLLLQIRGWVERSVHWLVKNRWCNDGVQPIVDAFAGNIQALRSLVPATLPDATRENYNQRCESFTDQGVSNPLAATVASVIPLSSSFDLLEVEQHNKGELKLIAEVYFELGEFLKLRWLRDQIGALDASSHWHMLAASSLRDDLHQKQRELCAEIVSAHQNGESAATIIERWADSSGDRLTIYNQRVNEIMASSHVDYAMLSLAVNEVQKLQQVLSSADAA